MFLKEAKFKQGFTLIELLVVVAIIGLMASVVMASLSSARDKAQDARRKADLQQIRTALQLYHSKCGTFVVKVNCTGSTYGSNGSGWFNHPYTATGSVAQGLLSNGATGGIIADPSGVTTSNGIDRSGYMIVADANNYTVWANLKNPSATDIATQNTCYFSSYDSYTGSYPAAARMNYCVSS